MDNKKLLGRGFSFSDKTSLFIGTLPKRKQYVLYISEGTELTPLAYFKTQELAKKGLEFLDKLYQSNKE